MERLRLSGRVVTGVGEGAFFTQVSWARNQFIQKLGIDPYPGTLNLRLDTTASLTQWANLKTDTSCLITPPDTHWCTARCFPVRIEGWFPGAIILPEVPNYPEAQIEIIAALPLRPKFSLTDGTQLNLELVQPLPVRAVIFDVDGTLVDSVDAYRVLAERAAAPHGIPITRDVVRYALNTNHPTFWDLVVPADRPGQADLIAELTRSAMRLWPDVLREYGGIFPDLRKTLEHLRAQKIRLAIVTGSQGSSLQPLRETGLIDYFEAIITGADVEKSKPDPEGLLKCLAFLEIHPDEAVYVGDTPIDVQASRAAGMASVAVLSGAGDSALLSAEGPNRLIYDHTFLPDVLLLD